MYDLRMRNLWTQTNPIFLLQSYIDLFSKIETINWAAVIMAVVSMVILIVTKEFINPKVKKKIKMPVPIELIVVRNLHIY